MAELDGNLGEQLPVNTGENLGTNVPVNLDMSAADVSMMQDASQISGPDTGFVDYNIRFDDNLVHEDSYLGAIDVARELAPEFDDQPFKDMIDAHALDMSKYPAQLPNSNMNSIFPGNAGNSFNPFEVDTGNFNLSTPEGRKSFLASSPQVTSAISSPTSTPAYSHPISYNARKYELDRYYAHPDFAELGFHPFANNDAYYNTNSSKWDNFTRSRAAFSTLYDDAFTSNYRAIGDFFSGENRLADYEGAQAMEDAMRIGRSSSGGVRGFMNDLFVNSAYTAGIISNILLEEAVLAAAVYFSGGGASGVAGARTAVNFGRGAKAFSALKGAFSLSKYRAAGAQMLMKLKQFDNAKAFYAAAKGGTYALGRGLGRLLTPSTVYAHRHIMQAAKAGENMTNLAKGANYLGGFYRDIRAVNMAWAESKMEGGLIEKERELALYEDIYNYNDKEAPTVDQLNMINADARQAAFTSQMINFPIIYLSNKLVLGNSMRGIRPVRKAVDGSLDTPWGGIFYGGAKGKAKIGKAFSDLGDDWLIGNTFRRMYQAGARGSAKHMLAAGLKYSTANFAEGLQELAQEATAKGVSSYYDALYSLDMSADIDMQLADMTENFKNAKKTFYGTDTLERDPALNIMSAVKRGVNSQMSNEGFKVFMSGFLMGGMVQGPQVFLTSTVPNIFRKGYSKYKKDGKWDEFVAEKAKNRALAVEHLNNVYDDPNTFFNPNKLNALSQKAFNQTMFTSAANGDILSNRDAQDASIFMHLNTVNMTGKMGIFKDYLNDLQKMDDKSLREAFPEEKATAQTLRKRLDKFQKRANEVEKNYNDFNDEYINPFRPSRYKKNSIEYNREVIKEAAFNHAKMMALYTKDTFEQALVRSNGIYDKLTNHTALKSLSALDIDILTDPTKLVKELALLEEETKKEGVTKKEKELIADKKKRLELLTVFSDILNNPDNAVIGEGIAFQDLISIDEKGQPVFGTKEGVGKTRKIGRFDRRKIKSTGLEKAFIDYISYIADIKGETLQGKDLDKILVDIIDYGFLKGRSGDFYKAHMTLMNPEYMDQYIDRIAVVMKDVYEKFKDKNNQTIRLEKYQNKKIRIAWLQALGQEEGIQPNPDETILFLEKGIIPIEYYSEDGKITPAGDIVRYKRVQARIEDLKKSQSTSKAEETDAPRQESQASASTETDDTNNEPDFESIVGRTKYQQFYNKDQDTKDIIEKLHKQYKATYSVTDGAYMDLNTWAQSSSGGKNIIKSRYELDQYYQNDENIDKEKFPTMDSWLKDNARNPLIVGTNGILTKNDITYSDVSPEQAGKSTLPKDKTDSTEEIIVADELTGITLLKSTTYDDNNNPEVTYTVVDGKSKNIYDRFKDLDPGGKKIQRGYIKKPGETPAQLEKRARNAYEFYRKNLPTGKSFMIDGKAYTTGDVVEDAAGNRYIIKSSEGMVKKFKNVFLVPIDKSKAKKGKDDREYKTIKEFRDEGFKKIEEGEVDLTSSLTTKVNQYQPLNLFGFVGSKVQEGYEFYGKFADVDLSDDDRFESIIRQLTPAQRESMEILMELNPNYKPWKEQPNLKNFNVNSGFTANNDLSYGQNKYQITIIIGGKPIAIMAGMHSALLFTPEGNPIDATKITAEQAEKLFIKNKGQTSEELAASVRRNYTKAALIVEELENKIGANGGRIKATDLKHIALNITPGFHGWRINKNDTPVLKGGKTAKTAWEDLDSVEFAEGDENYTIIYDIKKDRKGVPRASRVPTSNLEPGSRAEQLIQERIYNQLKRDGYDSLASIGMGRYVQFVTMKNGTVAYFEIKLDALSTEDGKVTVEKIKGIQQKLVDDITDEEGNFESKTDKFDPETVGDQATSELYDLNFYVQTGTPGTNVFMRFNKRGGLEITVKTNDDKTVTQFLNTEDLNEIDDLHGFSTIINNRINKSQDAKDQKLKINLTDQSFVPNLPINLSNTDALKDIGLTANIIPQLKYGQKLDINFTNDDLIKERMSDVNFFGTKKNETNDTVNTESEVTPMGLTTDIYNEITESEVIPAAVLQGIKDRIADVGYDNLEQIEKDIADLHEEQTGVSLILSGPESTIEGALSKDENGLQGEYNNQDLAKKISNKEQQLKTLKTKLNNQFITDFKEANPGQTEGQYKLQARNAVKNAKEVKDLVNEIKKLKEGLIGKIVNDNFDGRNVEEINKFMSWAHNNLPEYIWIKDIEDLGRRLISNGVTLGAFAIEVNKLSKNIKDLSGTVYVGSQTGFRYHEAFHAVFRMMLTEAEIKNFLSIANNDVTTLMNSRKGYEIESGIFVKSMASARAHMRTLSRKYAEMNDRALNEVIYEEYIADQFELFKTNPQSTKIDTEVKSFFQRLINFIKNLFSSFSKGDLQGLFNDINTGKYKAAPIQKNRFTESALTDSTILEQTGAPSNIAFAIRKGDPIERARLIRSTREETELQFIHNYFSQNETEVIVGSITARFFQRQEDLINEKDFNGTYNPKDLLNEVIEEYIENQNPARMNADGSLYYAEDENFDDYADQLEERYEGLRKYKKDVTKSVSEFLNLFDTQIEDAEIILDRNVFALDASLKSDEDFEASANEIGGYKSVSKGIRVFFATRFKSVQDPVTGKQVLAPVNYIHTYNLFMKALAGVTDPNQMLARLKYFENENDDTRAVIGDLFTRFNLSEYTLEDFVTGSYDVTQIRSQGFFQSVISGFTQLRSDYYQLEVDEGKKLVNIFKATNKDDASTQIDNWQDHYSILVKGLNDSQTKRDAASAAFNRIEFLAAKDSLSDNKLKDASEKIAEDIFNTTGINITPMTVKFIILNGGVTNKTKEQRKFVRLFKPDSTSIFEIEDLQYISSAIDAHGRTESGKAKANLFYDMVEEDLEDENSEVSTGTDVKFRIRKLAQLNAIFDTTVGATVFRNAEGKLIYAHQMPTYNLVKVAELNSEDAIDELLENPFLTKQAMLMDPRFKDLVVSGKLRVSRLGGVKYTNLESDAQGNFKANNKFTKGNGNNKSFGSISGAEFQALAVNLYLSDFNNATGKMVDRYYIDPITKKKVPYTTSLNNITVISESNTADWVSLPVLMTVEYKGGKSNITDETIDKFEDTVIRTEANRIHRERFEKEGYTEDSVLGYNDSASGRAYRFYSGKHLLSLSKTKVEKLNQLGVNQGVAVVETVRKNIENLDEDSQQLLIMAPATIQKLGLRTGTETIGSIYTTGQPNVLSEEKYIFNSLGVQASETYTVEELKLMLGKDLTNTKTNNNKYKVNLAGQVYYTRTKTLLNWLKGKTTANLVTVGKVDPGMQAIFEATGLKETEEKTEEKSVNDQMLARLEKAANEDENFDYDRAKRDIERDLGVTVKDLIRKRLEQEFDEWLTILSNNKGLDQIDNRLISRLSTSTGKTQGDSKKSMTKLNLVANNPDNHNLKQIFYNEWLNRTLVKQILLKDPSKLFKDSIDEIKRAKALNAAGPNASSIISSPYVYNEEGDIISGLGVDHNVGHISLMTFQDINVPSRFGRNATDDKKVTSTDAQMYYTTKAFRYLMFGIGSLNSAQARILDRIEKGDNISIDDFYGAGLTKQGYKSLGAIINSKKFVYFDGEVFLKMSAFVLTKRLTSDPETNFETALPDTVHLHNLRVAMEAAEENGTDTIALAVPESASKAVKKNIIPRETILNENFDLRDEAQYQDFINKGYITSLHADWMRLQQITPSNKGVVTDPTQIRQLITSEQEDNVLVTIGGEQFRLGQVRALYNRVAGDRVEIKYLQRRNLIFDYQTAQDELQDSIELGEVTVDLHAFLMYAKNSLEAGGAGPQFMELFEMDETGAQKYDLNNPLTQGKFQQLFLAFFAKGQLSEKTTGESLALVSSFGKKFYKRVVELDEETGQPIRWDVIRREDWLKTRETIAKKEYDNVDERTFVKGSLKVGDIYLDELRMDVKEYDEKGNETGLVYSELAIPAWDPRLKYIKAGEAIPDAVAKMFAVRIPSQDKHSAMNGKVVDFLPVEYGSVVMSPTEMIEISGADFDIDKLYATMKDFYVKDGKFIEYGKTQDVDVIYKEYIDWMIMESKKRGTSMSYAVDLFNTRGGILDNVEYESDSLPSEAIVGALKILALPVTKKEFENYIRKHQWVPGIESGALGKRHYRLPYTAAQNNQLIDLKFAMLGNKAMTEPKFGREMGLAYEPAVHDPVQDVADELLGKTEIVDGSVVEYEALLPSLAELVREEGLIIESPTGMYRTWVNNKAGAGAIGAVVLPNIIVNILKEYNLEITNGDVPTFNGKQYSSFDSDYMINYKTGKLDEKGLRKQFIISALVTAATDNAKLRLLGKLGLTREMLALTVGLTALGIELKTSMLLINGPTVRDMVARNAAGEGSLNFLLAQRIYDLERDDDVRENANKIKVTQEMMIDDINDPGSLDKDEQLAILRQFRTALRLSQFLRSAQVLSTNTSFDFTSIEDINLAYEDMNKVGVGLNDKEFEDAKIPIDMRKLFDGENTFQGRYVKILENLKQSMPSVFVTMSPTFQKFRNVTKSNIPFADSKKVEKDLLSFFIIKAYMKALENPNKGMARLAISLQNGFIYDEMASGITINTVLDNIRNVLKSRKESNNFMEWLAKRDTKNPTNKAMINMAVGKTWSNLTTAAITDLQNGIRDLYSIPELKEDVRHLIHYLLLKDGLQYTRDTFIDIIPVPLLDDILNVSGNVTELFNNEQISDSQFVNMFGNTKNELLREWVEGYSQSRGNIYFLTQVKRMKGKYAHAQIFTPDTKKRDRNSKPILLHKDSKDGLWEIEMNANHKKGKISKKDTRKKGKYYSKERTVDERREKNTYKILDATKLKTKSIEVRDKGGTTKKIELIGFPQEVKMDVNTNKKSKGDVRTFKLVYLYTPTEAGSYEDMINFNEDNIAYGLHAKYEEVKALGSMQQNSIGFIHGPRSTYDYLQAKKDNRDSDVNTDNINTDPEGMTDAQLKIAGNASKDPIGMGMPGVKINATENSYKITIEVDKTTGQTNLIIPKEKSKVEDNTDATQGIKLKAKPNPNTDYSVIEDMWDDFTNETKTILSENQNITSVQDAINRYEITNNLVPVSQEVFMDRLKKCK